VLWRRHFVGYLFDKPGFLIDTLRNNIYFGRLCETDQFEKAVRAAGVSVIAHQKPHNWEEQVPADAEQFLSAGERKRIGIARILVGRCRVLILDEPVANLNPDLASDIAANIARATSGISSLIITHEPHLIETDFNVFLNNGRVAAVGKHLDLLHDCEEYRHRFGTAGSDMVRATIES
jgi:ABC-type transport system involved in cytochrome bd biosynthesis fused ATPase/permease subunit